MAERRMFAKSVVDSDVFLDMPITARLLYYDLGMRADDDGFVGSPKKIMRMVGASQDDLRILVAKRFVIPFDSGVVVIRHWKQNNYLRPDRHTPTVYADELSLLTESKTGTYEPMAELGIPNANQLVDERYTQDSKGKDSKDKSNKSRANAVAYEAEFEEVWKLYPNKKGKPNALRDYSKARAEGISRETIENGIRDYIAECKRLGTQVQYIAHGSTWFHQRRWEDEYSDDEPYAKQDDLDFDVAAYAEQMKREGLL